MDDVSVEVLKQIDAADLRYGGLRSTHEGYGVLAEEMAELLEAIRSNKLETIREEAIQVAAVAMRLAAACRGDDAFARRSGVHGL